MSDNRYRQLLILYVALVAAAFVSAILPSTYSQELANAYASEPRTWLMQGFWRPLAVLVPLLAAWLVGLVGLFRFSRWGRAFALYFTIAGLFVYPFMGPALSAALDSTLVEAHTILWGAVLALAYYSPVSVRFER
jgi:hypothetical protein